MTETLVHRVVRAQLPDGYARRRYVPRAGQAPGSDALYDTDTLFYEAVAQGDRITLICPRLLNFAKLLRRARVFVGGRPARLGRIRTYYRHSLVTLRRPEEAGDDLRILLPDGAEITAIVQPERLDFLTGLTCEMLISRNNPLEWIEQKLRWHVRGCGLQSVLFIDNGSTDYSLEALREVLERVGLARVVLLSMPFKWGPVNLRPMHRELFLQTSAYNLARVKYLQAARAVLRMDIDEVLMDGSVFDRAVAARTGFVIFNGAARYPGADRAAPFRYSDHVWRDDPDKLGGGNWCLNPRGPLGRFQWRCHNLEHNILDRFQKLPGAHYYDCTGMTTGWKDAARLQPAQGKTLDARTAAFWKAFARV